jgi:hypothetical protein
MSISTP